MVERIILEAIKIYSDVCGGEGGEEQKERDPVHVPLYQLRSQFFFWILKLCPDVFKEHNFYISYESERLVLLRFLCWEKIRLKTQNSAPL